VNSLHERFYEIGVQSQQNRPVIEIEQVAP